MNEDRKERYIKYRQELFGGEDTCERVVVNLFKEIERFEKEYNKDCADFLYPEIMNFYKYLGTYSVNTLMNLNSQLSNYTSWCINEHLVKDNQNHYSEIRPADLSSVVNPAKLRKQYLTRDDVLKICNTMPETRYKVMFLCLFEGIKGDQYREIYDLTRDDLRGNNMVYIKDRGKAIEVSPQLYHWMEQSVNDFETTSEHFRKGTITHQFDPSERDKVVKIRKEGGIDLDEGDRAQKKITYLLSKALKEYTGDIDTRGIKPTTFNDSGIVHFILERAKENYETPMQYFESPAAIREIKDRFGRRIIRTIFLTGFGDYLK